jgi:hypothetical protein
MTDSGGIYFATVSVCCSFVLMCLRSLTSACCPVRWLWLPSQKLQLPASNITSHSKKQHLWNIGLHSCKMYSTSVCLYNCTVFWGIFIPSYFGFGRTQTRIGYKLTSTERSTNTGFQPACLLNISRLLAHVEPYVSPVLQFIDIWEEKNPCLYSRQDIKTRILCPLHDTKGLLISRKQWHF